MDQALLNEARRIDILTSWYVQLTIPSVLAVGEEFQMRVTAFGPDGLPADDFPYSLQLSKSSGVEGLPERFDIPKGTNGMITIDGLTATDAPVAFVDYFVMGTGMYGDKDPEIWSNPAWIFSDPKYRIYWGDIHVHTVLSNCHPEHCKDPEFCYQYARDAAHLDFAGAADHLRGIMLKDDGRWDRLQELVQQYDAPGSFLPILAFESSHAKGFGGDNNVYFKDTRGPLFWPDRDDMRGYAPKVHLEELWKFLDESGADYMTIPHHTARMAKNRTFDETYYSRQREPLFEIYSGWGSSERPDNRLPLSGGNSPEQAYFIDALRHGYRYGVIASSDDHSTMPGGCNRHRGAPLRKRTLTGWHQKGLAAVRARSLSRDDLWTAMRNRNTYGTTLSRTLIDFTLGDASMGQEISLGADQALANSRVINAQVTLADDYQSSISLVRNGDVIATRKLVGREERHDITFVDDTAFDEIAIKGAQFNPEPFVSYYLKVQSPQSSFTQWTSPIWLDQ